jgi:predicted transposase/invertase (TIGR01784 family)
MRLVIKDDEPLNKANEKYEYFNSDDQLRKMYNTYIEQKRKYHTDIEIAEKKGMEKGIEKDKLDVARKMKEENLPIDLIKKITGLSKEEIEKL